MHSFSSDIWEQYHIVGWHDGFLATWAGKIPDPFLLASIIPFVKSLLVELLKAIKIQKKEIEGLLKLCILINLSYF